MKLSFNSMKNRLALLPIFVLSIVLINACVLSLGGSQQPTGKKYHVIMQTEKENVSSLEKDYQHFFLAFERTLSTRNGIQLFSFYPGDQNPKEVAENFNKDVRIQSAHLDTPTQLR